MRGSVVAVALVALVVVVACVHGAHGEHHEDWAPARLFPHVVNVTTRIMEDPHLVSAVLEASPLLTSLVERGVVVRTNHPSPVAGGVDLLQLDAGLEAGSDGAFQLVFWIILYQFFATAVCYSGSLYRYCPGPTGWHAIRSVVCSSHLWILRRVSLPYECLNVCCDDRLPNGEPRTPTAFSHLSDGELLTPEGQGSVDEITALRLDSCDYPGIPPPGWYKTWKAAMRDGICTMGPPIYENPLHNMQNTGGVYHG